VPGDGHIGGPFPGIRMSDDIRLPRLHPAYGCLTTSACRGSTRYSNGATRASNGFPLVGYPVRYPNRLFTQPDRIFDRVFNQRPES
jgi:hypothetical protein